MIKLAMAISPKPGLEKTLLKQIGVDYAVGGIGLRPVPDAGDDEQPFSYSSLKRAKDAYRELGFTLSVIESRPPMEKIKLALPGRDEEIEVVQTLLRSMGALEIPVWCSEWMPILHVLRTSKTIPTRGGALVTGYDHELMRNEPLTDYGIVDETEQWANLKYFLECVVPVAEEANVRMAMHPADPPLSPIRGMPRLMRSLENYQKLIDLVPSPSNGIALCQGNFSMMTDDLPAAIRHFGRQDKINFVHFRDVRGTPEKFHEVFHDDGPTDLVECLRAYRDVGYERIARPDHYPKMGDGDFRDENRIARLFAIGYFKGLREAVYSE